MSYDSFSLPLREHKEHTREEFADLLVSVIKVIAVFYGRAVSIREVGDAFISYRLLHLELSLKLFLKTSLVMNVFSLFYVFGVKRLSA